MAGAKPAVHVVQLKQISVPESLVKGSKFLKWDDSSTSGVPVTLKVDPKGYILYWRDQNKDMDYLDISIIRDTRTGKYAKVPKEGKLRDSCSMIGSHDIPLEDKTVTICYGTDMVNVETVNFVCATRETAQEWCDELFSYATNLLSQNASTITFLEKAYTRLTHVLDVNGKIPVKNISKMIASHKDDKRRVERALESAGFKAQKNDIIDPNKFTFEDFFTFYRQLIGRTESDMVFDGIGAKKKPYLTAEQFVKFLNKEQRDPRLNEILYPYYSIKQAIELINQYETKPNMAAKGHFSQEGFLKFLMSEENNLIPAEHLDLSQDMNVSLSHYFINSSHNTYLTGHQFTGRSSVEIYSQVLLSGCRCIELDCWDGKGADEEPIITHGFTMCTEVSFKEVIEAIAASAFKTTDYPVILSFENHCSVRQQAKMAAYCRNIFGDMLLTESLEGYVIEPSFPLPSPEEMKRKIIVKNRKKHFHKGKGKVISTKPTNPPRKVKSSSIDNGTEEEGEEKEVKKVLVNQPASVEEEEPKHPPGSMGVLEDDMSDQSDSSSSDEDDDVTDLTAEEKNRREREVRERLKKEKIKIDKGTAGSEAEAGMEMSALVNYIQPVHFHSFDMSDKKNRSYEISSFVETQASSLLKEHPVEFVNYNKRQLSRIYPRGTRVDSSNFMPQIYWNAGCQLVALNFQHLDLAMQLNMGIFEYNGRSGYILKPDFMRRKDRHFDPFAESTVDGIVAGTVHVRVISGQLLTDKKVGTYVEVDMFGLPTDTVRKKFRTKTVPNNGINPIYDEQPFVFRKVVLPNLAVIRIGVYEETGKLIGHRVLPVEALRPGYRHINLRNECNQPLLLPTIFVQITVHDFVPDGLAEFADALANPISYLSSLEKHELQLAVLEDDEDEDDPDLKSSEVTSGSVNPSPNKRNGSLTNDPDFSGVCMEQAHPGITKVDSVVSNQTISSNNSGSMKVRHTRLSGSISGVSRLANTENGAPSPSVVATTRLNEPSLLVPTPMSELKKDQKFEKAVEKKLKELQVLKKKHEKARINMKEIHSIQEEKLMVQQLKDKTSLEKTHSKVLKRAMKDGADGQIRQQQNMEEYTNLVKDQSNKLMELKKSQTEVFVAMCKDQFKAELEVSQKHAGPSYDCLKGAMEMNHRDHTKHLQDIHDEEVKSLTKRIDAQTKDEMKTLAKKHKDKQTLSRLKREAQKKHIDTVVAERKKLEDILQHRLVDLKEKLGGIKQEFEKERQLEHKNNVEQMNESCRILMEQFKDLLEVKVTSSGTTNISPVSVRSLEQKTQL